MLKTFRGFLEDQMLEMAISRKEALTKISYQGSSLSEHILNILAFQQMSDWDQTIFDVMREIDKIINSSKVAIKQDMTKKILMRNVTGVMDSLVKVQAKHKGLKVIGAYSEEIYSNIVEGLLKIIYSEQPYTRQDVTEIMSEYV